MYFNKISQLLSLAALSGTALGYPLAGNSISGLAARDIDSGAQILSPRRDPSKPPSDAPSHPFGTWFPEPPAVSVNNGNGGSNVGTGTGRGNIRAR